MIVQSLLGEFKHEAENTRKLLNAIPDSALEWKPSEKNWTTGQLASHIAEVYNWYPGTIQQSVFDMGGYKYDKGDISKAANIVAKFEENVKLAQSVLESATDASMMENWTMTMGGQDIMPPMPRIQVIRGFLFNHLYHHRGELVVYLRATGNAVPGLYGPTADDKNF
ncbi:MAG: DinB family protein [Chitinophagaceae bacterium]|nr:DinB family protein [Chitinophagaceae bacterium]